MKSHTQVDFDELIREYAQLFLKKTNQTILKFDALNNRLTEQEYLARDDVDYTLGDVYHTPVKTMNSPINDSYIEKLGGYFGNKSDKVGDLNPSEEDTGEGSVIAPILVLIVTYSEFTDSTDMQCFTNVCKRGLGTVEDGNRWGHGTHVAGIAPANLDGVGTTGVAILMHLFIGKLAYDSGFKTSAIPEAMEWVLIMVQML